MADDSVRWSVSVADATLDNLPAGQTLAQSYVVTISDGHGGLSMAFVEVLVTGTVV